MPCRAPGLYRVLARFMGGPFGRPRGLPPASLLLAGIAGFLRTGLGGMVQAVRTRCPVQMALSRLVFEPTSWRMALP